ncbi:MAG: amidohydrolase [Palaeococcus sp.]|uniref:amidohydrolase n=1 Tax=Palaeococcus sp. (in: euryarchaeotes) TaxID=2820298 RepID=UPI0025D321DD|nr:amidohydrolase [Palaeococcus sp. (in: euryarchaeotes)]MCD6559594.1 amidohydrolase [Palaeococcus sp. (in: euryarchaeotes)]
MIRAFLNGKIYTSFKPKKIVNALVVANERILYVGSNEKARKIARELGGEVIDLHGKVIFPGFIDSHLHLEELGMYLEMADLRGVKSIKELKEKVGDFAKKTKTTWILGHGWDQELFDEKRWPTRWDLDEVVKEKPVMLSRVCLHAAVLNTKAMELADLLEAELPGVIRDEDGKATGVVKEEAFELAREKFKETLTLKDYEHFLKTASDYVSSLGITAVGTVSVEERTLKALTNLEARRELRVRVFAYLDPGKRGVKESGMFENLDILNALKKLGIRSGFGRKKLKIQGIKILADGSLGARTAWLSEPYSDASTRGYPNISKELLQKIVREAHEAGLQMAVHGIGDATIDMILEVYSSLGDVEGNRHRIEHASILREDQIEKMAELGVVASVQPHFVITDWWVVKRVGEKRAKWVYPFKSMLERGIILGFSTDSPIEPTNPWETIYAAVTRGKHENVETHRYTEDEVMNLEEALHAYTYGSAYIMHAEKELGTLEEGKLADFIVLDRDPFEVKEKELRSIKVLETYVGGSKHY